MTAPRRVNGSFDFFIFMLSHENDANIYASKSKERVKRKISFEGAFSLFLLQRIAQKIVCTQAFIFYYDKIKND